MQSNGQVWSWFGLQVTVRIALHNGQGSSRYIVESVQNQSSFSAEIPDFITIESGQEFLFTLRCIMGCEESAAFFPLAALLQFIGEDSETGGPAMLLGGEQGSEFVVVQVAGQSGSGHGAVPFKVVTGDQRVTRRIG
jgi:hypothetical protein